MNEELKEKLRLIIEVRNYRLKEYERLYYETILRNCFALNGAQNLRYSPMRRQREIARFYVETKLLMLNISKLKRRLEFLEQEDLKTENLEEAA